MTTKPSVGIRIASMLLDHIFMRVIIMVTVLPSMLGSLSDVIQVHDEPKVFTPSDWPMYFSFFGFTLYLCKDCISGRSIAKRILKLQVVNSKTGVVAGPLRCLVRNLFDILWPVEIIATIINPSRRIGDYSAGTAVVMYRPLEHKSNVNVMQILLSILLGFVFIAGLSTLFYTVAGFGNVKNEYVSSSYNEQLSSTLEKAYKVENYNGCIDSLDINVYDKSVKGDYRYVSIILWLNHNCPTYGNYLDFFHEQAKRIVHQEIKDNRIEGKVKYVVKTPQHVNIQIRELK